MLVKPFETIQTLNIVLFYNLLFLTHMNFELEDFSLCNLKSILSKIDRLFPLFRT